MKKISLFLLTFSLLLACKSKKSAAVSTTSTAPTEEQLAAAKKKYPDADMATLNQGHNLYYGTCTSCHAAKDLTFKSIDGLPGIIERMAVKAKITPQEKDAVLKYVMGVKLAAIK